MLAALWFRSFAVGSNEHALPAFPFEPASLRTDTTTFAPKRDVRGAVLFFVHSCINRENAKTSAVAHNLEVKFCSPTWFVAADNLGVRFRSEVLQVDKLR